MTDILDMLPQELAFEWVDDGVWLGCVKILGLPFHVELLEVDVDGCAKNDWYENRLTDWQVRNEVGVPKLYELGGRHFFVHVEVYAR